MTVKADTTRSGRAVLPVVLAALALVVAAVPALNVALPGLARDTGATQSQLQWIVDAYALVFAALLLPAGALGDRYGRKPVLVTGLTVFALASGVASAVHQPKELIALRAVMGLGAALIMPTTLSIVTTHFQADKQNRAVGAWVGIAGAGAILGLITSGLLLEEWSWRSVFVLNLITAGVTAAAAQAAVPNSRDASPPAIDYLGAALLTAALTGIVYGAIEGPDQGWTGTRTVTAFCVGAVALAAFIGWGLRARNPLLDPRLFLKRGFAAGVLSLSSQFFVFFGFVFIVMQYFQLVLKYSTLSAGFALLPMGLVIGGLSRRAPGLLEHVGQRRMASGGLLFMAVGAAVLSRLGTSSSYWLVLAGILPLGVGMALATAPATTGIVRSVSREKQGVASAVNDASREVGGTLGIAVLGSVLNAAYRSAVTSATPPSAPPALAHAAHQSLGAALALSARIGAPGRALAAAAQQGFVDGFRNALLVSAVVLAVAAAVLAVLSPGRGTKDAGHDTEAPELLGAVRR